MAAPAGIVFHHELNRPPSNVCTIPSPEASLCREVIWHDCMGSTGTDAWEEQTPPVAVRFTDEGGGQGFTRVARRRRSPRILSLTSAVLPIQGEDQDLTDTSIASPAAPGESLVSGADRQGVHYLESGVSCRSPAERRGQWIKGEDQIFRTEQTRRVVLLLQTVRLDQDGMERS